MARTHEADVLEPLAEAEPLPVRSGGRRQRRVSVRVHVALAGLDLQRPRADQRADLGLAEEREAVLEVEIGRDGQVALAVAKLLDVGVARAD